ncbi:zinc-ribbon domain-containing protein [Arthrobacter sp. G.S.26]|uniref:zinc-ribbon domain-containing protein n=1 Tax=Arthrobacter sp. G.S.26 TaxID=3433706 RepID=UPI003D77D8E6
MGISASDTGCGSARTPAQLPRTKSARKPFKPKPGSGGCERKAWSTQSSTRRPGTCSAPVIRKEPDAALYELLIAVLSLISDRDFISDFFVAGQSYKSAFSYLATKLLTITKRDISRLATELWIYFRPTFLRVREADDDGLLPSVWEHDYRAIDASGFRACPAIGPIQKFSDYFSVISEPKDERTDWALRIYHYGEVSLSRRNVPRQTSKKANIICLAGHRIIRELDGLAKAIDAGSPGCRFCSRRVVLAGVNDLVTTHPLIAAEWDEARNGAAASEVLAGSRRKAWWKCPDGHSYQKQVAKRTAGEGCIRCRPGRTYGTIQQLFPQAASQWHPTMNGDTSLDQVTHGSSASYWWLCECGSSYQRRAIGQAGSPGCSPCLRRLARSSLHEAVEAHPNAFSEWHPTRNGSYSDAIPLRSTKRFWWRCRNDHNYTMNMNLKLLGGSCPHCAERTVQAIPGERIATAALAGEWIDELNGGLKLHEAKTTQRYVWRCMHGHAFQMNLGARLEGSGCPYCSNKKVMPAFNDVLTRFPQISVNWDEERNAVGPNEVLAGNRRWWWTCTDGHTYQQTVIGRMASRGCKQCPPSLRAIELAASESS